jgi:hypothetical protein
MAEPGVLDKIVKAVGSVGKSIATAPTGEAAGIKAKQDNIDDYMKSVSGEPAEPIKAQPPQANPDKASSSAKYGDRGNEKRIDTRDYTKALGSFAKGTTKVPKTGNYKLHEGEAVIPAKENPMNKGGMDAVMGLAKDKAPKKEIKEMVHSKTHNNKHMIVHKHHSPSHHPDETHVMNDMAELHQHMDDHAGAPNDGEAAPAGADQPAPMTPSPSPMPPAAAPGA